MSTSNGGFDGNALVYCEGAFATTNGKTAHGLVRRTRRYRVVGVIDSKHVDQDAGTVLDGEKRGIPIFASVEEGMTRSEADGNPATHLVVGLAPDGGGLPGTAREAIVGAIRNGLNVDSGLHVFLSEDPELSRLASESGVALRDVRKPPPRSELHFFSGAIERVSALRVAVLGTDSAVGKRTTAWELIDGLEAQGIRAELVGTGQTAWMQGARYGVIFDSLVNDFVTGEIEHAVARCDEEQRPRVIVLEGQGSLMNPAYPGGLEILAAGRPHLVILQHAPARKVYDGFPGYPLHPLPLQIQAVELLCGKPVVAIAVNSERLASDQVPTVCRAIERETDRPALDVLREGPARLAEIVVEHLEGKQRDNQWPIQPANQATR
jgi:uncharacterized NAD-dependent epimerase/dehydratase family protein